MSVAVDTFNNAQNSRNSRPASSASITQPQVSYSRPTTAPTPIGTRTTLLRQSLNSATSRSKQQQQKQTQLQKQRTLVSSSTTLAPMDEPPIQDTEERRKRKKQQTSTKKRSISVEGRFKQDTAYHPLYFIEGGNGIPIVERTLKALGWRRSNDKYASNIKLCWCDFKGQVDYNHFLEGEQMVNHIPNNELISNKLGLLTSLREYERVSTFVTKRNLKLHLSDFHPETFVLDDANEFDYFCSTFKEGELFICKPVGLNQGIGIYLIRSLAEFKRKWQEDKQKEQEEQRQARVPRPIAANSAGPKKEKYRMGGTGALRRIAQRYITAPLLLDNRKFDIRCYVLIACAVPYLVLWHSGYLRLSIYAYNMTDERNQVHLTNQYVQKKDAAYERIKSDTVWSMERFNDYFNEHIAASRGVERDWVLNVLPRRMREIIAHIFASVRSKLAARLGYFELFGLDFMIDDALRVWLIEVNTNPSLDVNVNTLASTIPPIVDEAVRIAIEAFDHAKRKQPLLPLASLSTFEIVFYSGKPPPPFNAARQAIANQNQADSSAAPTRGANASPILNASRLRAKSKSTVELATVPRNEATQPAVRRSVAPAPASRTPVNVDSAHRRAHSVGREPNNQEDERPSTAQPPESNKPTTATNNGTRSQTQSSNASKASRTGSGAYRQQFMLTAINKLQVENKQARRIQEKMGDLAVNGVRPSRGN